MLNPTLQDWLKSFRQSINTPGWVSRFVMMGPDDPMLLCEEMPDLFPTLKSARLYNWRVVGTVLMARKFKRLRATLRADLKRTHPTLSGFGRIANKSYTRRLLDNLLCTPINEDWV